VTLDQLGGSGSIKWQLGDQVGPNGGIVVGRSTQHTSYGRIRQMPSGGPGVGALGDILS
jgi:hypothetical protein